MAVALVPAQSIKLDTEALATKLKSVREYQALPAKDFRNIQAQSIAWIDKRMQARMPAGELNAELKAAGIFKPETPKPKDDDVMVNFTGFVDKVAIDPIPGADDLIGVHIKIGLVCGFDETVLIYQTDPLRKVGTLDHHDPKYQDAQAFSSLLARGGILASGTYSVWCTSTLIRVNLRIDKIENGAIRTLLNQREPARFWADPDKLVQLSIDGSVVTFRYPVADADLMPRSAIARYSVSGNTATRIATR
jgi:hypothetical protein